MTPSGPRELVVLIDEEFVKERGTVEVVWLVQKNDGWIRAASFPGARRERLDASPGTVWRSRVEIELVRGASVVKVETRPTLRTASTLEHLTGRPRTAKRRVVRTRYKVGARGVLTPESAARRPK